MIKRADLEEKLILLVMLISVALVVGSLGFILLVVIARGLPHLSLEMLLQTPKGWFYLGNSGGILNAILGSLMLAGGATLLALCFGVPLALYLHVYANRSRLAGALRLALDVLWGVPSIVYGAFGFLLMLALGLRASLLGGILALALLELPVLARGLDEVLRLVSPELTGAAYALGATRLEAAGVLLRQVLPGLATVTLLAFGRGIGDAAAVLFTAGYTDRLPGSLFEPAASLPLAVFFQFSTPFPEVQGRAYASALVLTALILVISLLARWLAGRLGRFSVS